MLKFYFWKINKAMKLILSHNTELKRKQAIVIADKYREGSPVDEVFKTIAVKYALYISERSDAFKLIKYKGQQLWTEKAINHFIKNGIKGLRHEHVIPRKLIEQEILDNKDKSKERIFTVLDKLLHAVIVTKEEAAFIDIKYKSSIPVEFQISNRVDYLLSRYKESNINVFYIESGDPKNFVEKIKVI